MKSMKSKVALLLLILTLINVPNAFAYDWAKENSSGIPSLVTPFFIPNTGNRVNSSYNEPRDTEVHKGTDHKADLGTQIGPMYNGGASVYYNWDPSSGLKYQVIKYTGSGTTFYTSYLHVSKFLISQGTPVSLSDRTVETGESGSLGSPHLHFEINPSDPSGTNFGTRISVNPRDYMSDSLQYDRSVFKFFSSSYVSATLRKITIKAEDVDRGISTPLSTVHIYYKSTSSSTWSGPYAMSSLGSGNFEYYLGGTSGSTYEIIIAGRRYTTEYWVTYPAKKYTEVGKGSSISIGTLGTWDTAKVTF